MPAISPVYIFKGDEKYLKKEAIEKLKTALLEKGSEAFNFNTYEMGRCDAKDILDALQSAPIISAKRLIIISGFGSASEKEKSLITEYVKNPSKNSCLVIDLSREELQGDFYASLRAHAKEMAFIPPKGDRLVSWIQAEFKKRAKPIRYEAAATLAEIKEEDMGGLINEIEKLVAYAGKEPLVTKDHVEKLTGASLMRSVFDLVDALSMKDAKRSLLISNELLKAKKAVPEILGMVGWQLRRVRRVKDLMEKGSSERTISEKCKVPQNRMGGFLKDAGVFTKKEIDKSLEFLLEADHGIKTGHLKPQDALEMLIVRICTAPDNRITGTLI
ncbi:MAG: DNA polymerase III subunit delta [Candidatus Omnitrophota bacterium]